MASGSPPTDGRREPAGPRDRESRTLPLISGNLRPYHLEIAPAAGTDSDGVLARSTTPDELDREYWSRELDDEQAIGFDLLWLSHAMHALEVPPPSDPLGDLLDLCAGRNFKVILATDFSPRWYERLDVDQELSVATRSIRIIAERYGEHPAFFAWYLPHEIYVTWGDMAHYMDEIYPALVSRCREATNNKPVTLSPFFILDRDRIFGDYRYATPDEYGDYWARLIARSGLDIIMLQDSGEHFSYVTNEQRRPFFEAMASACRTGGATLWGNVESAEYVCPSIEEFVRRYGRVHHSTVKELPWRPVPVKRLQGKLELAAECCERIVSWGYYQFGRPHLGPEALKWYQEYQQYYESIRLS